MDRYKILDLFIGDKEKWRKVPIAFKEFSEDMKIPHIRNKLILLGILNIGIIMSFMYGVYYIQNNAQYCNFKTEDGTIIETGIKNNMSYSWYKDNINFSEIDINTPLYCEWDIKRFKGEIFNE